MPLERLINAFIALACAGLLAFGYYLQYAQGLEPCPLCILQRAAYLVTGALCLVALLQRPGPVGLRIYGALALLCTLAGGGVALRQIWLQNLPPERVPECGPGLDYLLEAFPLFDALKLALTGSGECAETLWTFLGLNIAEWSLTSFGLLSGLLVYQLYHSVTHRR